MRQLFIDAVLWTPPPPPPPPPSWSRGPAECGSGVNSRESTLGILLIWSFPNHIPCRNTMPVSYRSVVLGELSSLMVWGLRIGGCTRGRLHDVSMQTLSQNHSWVCLTGQDRTVSDWCRQVDLWGSQQTRVRVMRAPAHSLPPRCLHLPVKLTCCALPRRIMPPTQTSIGAGGFCNSWLGSSDFCWLVY